MKKKYERVYQFKITLEGIKPRIWRRIQVPETYTFWDLHVAIQDAMGWLDYHLHEFEIVDPSTGLKVNIGMPDEDFGREILPDWKQKIADYFSMENRSADYVYDFGDNWEHKIRLEKILPRNKNINYPICIKGERACPPEDCGGDLGYARLLEILKNPNHEEYEEMLEWVGGKLDPEHFDPKEVSFDDPEKRRRIVYG
ncbi:MAG TPA: plasmid pRiA4b ORF-3 family protein [bacterium (Candidatus Stahlbacteria)]|nr:plasmid pRiA4b ORF-3 family protein [Candidatus Stahlbacteria bacterium]